MKAPWFRPHQRLRPHVLSMGVLPTRSGDCSAPDTGVGAFSIWWIGRVMGLRRGHGYLLEESWIGSSSRTSTGGILTSPLSDGVDAEVPAGGISHRTLRLPLLRCPTLTPNLVRGWGLRGTRFRREAVTWGGWTPIGRRNSDPPPAPPSARLGGAPWGLLGPSLVGGVLS